jgi:hypothetical protein
MDCENRKPVIEWTQTVCFTCHGYFYQRLQDENRQGVYEQNCPRCRQRMGHPTQCDWLGTR